MRSGEQGILLLDVVIATALITIAVAALGPCFVGSLKTVQYSKARLTASYLAQQKLEQMKSVTNLPELGNSDEMLTLDHQEFYRHLEVEAHSRYASLFVVTVTVYLPEQLERPLVCYSTYILNRRSALHP